MFCFVGSILPLLLISLRSSLTVASHLASSPSSKRSRACYASFVSCFVSGMFACLLAASARPMFCPTYAAIILKIDREMCRRRSCGRNLTHTLRCFESREGKGAEVGVGLPFMGGVFGMWAWSRGDGKGAFLGKLWGESKEDISVGFESRAEHGGSS